MSEYTKKRRLEGDALVNKVALIILEIINASLFFGYISDYMAGNATAVYFALVEAATIFCAVAVPIVYKMAPAKMKYVAFVTFTIVYFVAMYSPALDIVFVLAFPIIMVFVLYYDFKLMRAMAITFAVITTLDCINVIFILKKHHSGLPLNSSIILMEVLGTFIFLVAAVVSAKITKENNDEKINEIQGVADRVNSSIKEINVEIGQLNESTSAAKQAMEEINSGISSTAEAVQNQLIQTEAIQDRIENVEDEANKINQNVEITMSAVETGQSDVTTLVEQADMSVEISDKVIEDLNNLKTNVEAMNGITKMIENVAFQTNIMALNANVEAAHAGEIGRGFAVVATEISNMSTQTKEATEKITDMITNATDSLDELVRSVTKMAEVIRSEKEQTMQTSEVFADIQKNTEEVKEHIALFMDYISGLTDANREIVHSVSTISASTQQVTALTTEAVAKEVGNADHVSIIANQIGQLAQN